MAVDVRFEVWTRPESGTFTRRFPIRGSGVAFSLNLGIFGGGSLTLPKNFPRLDEIMFIDPSNHANDVASMIRAYIGDTHLYDFYASKAEINFGDKGARLATISGGGPGSVLDRTFVFPYDYTTNPSVQPDWDYGSDKAEGSFSNGGFEKGGYNGDAESGALEPWKGTPDNTTFAEPTDLVVSVTDPKTGTYSFEVTPSALHSGMQYTLDVLPGERVDFTAFLKETTAAGRRYTMYVKMGKGSTMNVGQKVWSGWALGELDGAAYSAGASDGTWQTLDVAVTFGAEVESTTVVIHYDDHDGGSVLPFFVDDIVITGAGLTIDSWTPIGVVDTFEIDTVIFKSGVNSLQFQNGAGAGVPGTATESGIRQIVEGLTIGVTYTFSGWFQHDDIGSETIALIVQRPSGVWYSSQTAIIPTGTTWVYVSRTFVADTTTVWLNAYHNDAGASPNWYVDDALLAVGLAPATYGEIMGDFLDDAATDHVADGRSALDFLVKTFDNTNDSDVVAWDKDVSFSVKRGQPYRRILTFHGDKFGYEADIHPNAADDTIIEFDLFNVEAQGQDFTSGAGGAVTRSGLVNVGPFIRRDPIATYAMVEGDELFWGESTDATLETAWGEIESYSGSNEMKEVELTTLAGNITADKEAETISAKFQNPNLVPGVDYKLGDIVMLVLGEDILPAAAYRVMSIDVSSGDPEPMFQVQFVSEGL